ncbi:hypothetical protein DFH06DRAFT_250928 [Mycena polygramma]|nr:hypothetical protein DFH06DRAFT_250928 [Mycena polygramma]
METSALLFWALWRLTFGTKHTAKPPVCLPQIARYQVLNVDTCHWESLGVRGNVCRVCSSADTVPASRYALWPTQRFRDVATEAVVVPLIHAAIFAARRDLFSSPFLPSFFGCYATGRTLLSPSARPMYAPQGFPSLFSRGSKTSVAWLSADRDALSLSRPIYFFSLNRAEYSGSLRLSLTRFPLLSLATFVFGGRLLPYYGALLLPFSPVSTSTSPFAPPSFGPVVVAFLTSSRRRLDLASGGPRDRSANLGACLARFCTLGFRAAKGMTAEAMVVIQRRAHSWCIVGASFTSRWSEAHHTRCAPGLEALRILRARLPSLRLRLPPAPLRLPVHLLGLGAVLSRALPLLLLPLASPCASGPLPSFAVLTGEPVWM